MEEKNIGNTESRVRLDEKVVVKSIAPWATGARRILTIGDIQIQPNGVGSVSREEIIAQGQSGNKLLTGIDGRGTHATWYIEDEFSREELGFDDGKKKQVVVSNDTVKKAFSIKTDKAFEKFISENFKTRAERTFLTEAIKSLKLSETAPYVRVSFCETLAGVRL